MDRLGIATSLLSISSPGVHFGDGAAALDLARAVNEAGRRAVVDHPGRFGLLASLPLPDVDAAIAEIALLLRPPRRRRLRAAHQRRRHLPRRRRRSSRSSRELDRRARPGARSTRRRRRAGSTRRSAGPRPMLEFLFDTTRAVVDLVLNGTVAATRTSSSSSRTPARRCRWSPTGSARSRSLLDVDPTSTCCATSAGCTSTSPASRCPRQLDALLTLTTLDHLHYGSDYPFTPEFVVAAAAERLDGVDDPAGSAGDPAGEHRTALRRPPSLSRVSAERIDEPIVPTVDIGDWAGGDAETLGSIAAAVDDACRTVGFMQIIGHGVDDAVASLTGSIDWFFGLPSETKHRSIAPRPSINRGYTPPCSERLSYSLCVVSPDDLFEAFNVGAAVSDFPELDL